MSGLGPQAPHPRPSQQQGRSFCWNPGQPAPVRPTGLPWGTEHLRPWGPPGDTAGAGPHRCPGTAKSGRPRLRAHFWLCEVSAPNPRGGQGSAVRCARDKDKSPGLSRTPRGPRPLCSQLLCGRPVSRGRWTSPTRVRSHEHGACTPGFWAQQAPPPSCPCQAAPVCVPRGDPCAQPVCERHHACGRRCSAPRGRAVALAPGSGPLLLGAAWLRRLPMSRRVSCVACGPFFPASRARCPRPVSRPSRSVGSPALPAQGPGSRLFLGRDQAATSLAPGVTRACEEGPGRPDPVPGQHRAPPAGPASKTRSRRPAEGGSSPAAVLLGDLLAAPGPWAWPWWVWGPLAAPVLDSLVPAFLFLQRCLSFPVRGGSLLRGCCLAHCGDGPWPDPVLQSPAPPPPPAPSGRVPLGGGPASRSSQTPAGSSPRSTKPEHKAVLGAVSRGQAAPGPSPAAPLPLVPAASPRRRGRSGLLSSSPTSSPPARAPQRQPLSSP